MQWLTNCYSLFGKVSVTVLLIIVLSVATCSVTHRSLDDCILFSFFIFQLTFHCLCIVSWSTSLLFCISVILNFYQSNFLAQVDFLKCTVHIHMPSVLWRCWLGERKGIRPVKNWVVGCWHGYLSGVRCRLAHGPADATATRCLLLQ